MSALFPCPCCGHSITKQDAAGFRIIGKDEVDPARQPIETAPRDGTEVLVWGAEQDGAYLGAYRDGWWVADAFPDTWTDLVSSPTHWMPLPSDPVRAIGRKA